MPGKYTILVDAIKIGEVYYLANNFPGHLEWLFWNPG